MLADTVNDTRFVITRGQSLNDERVTSQAAVISDSGSHVVFESNADQFARMVEAADDDVGANDLFVYELASGEITHASKPHPSLPFPSRAYRNADISRNGRYLAFNSSRRNASQDGGTERVYRLDRMTNEVLLISKTLKGLPNDGRANRPKMSGDGSKIVFTTVSPSLLGQTGNDLNLPLFMWQQNSEATRQLALPAPTRFFGPTFAISGNGRFIAYSARKSLAAEEQRDQLWLYDLLTEQGQIVAQGDLLVVGTLAAIQDPVLSNEGRYIGYTETRRGTSISAIAPDPSSLFRTDRFTGINIELTGNLSPEDSSRSRSPAAYPAMSADGSALTFTSSHPAVTNDLNTAPDVFLSRQRAPGGALYSAILPSSRSAGIDEPTTAYAKLIATQELTGCRLELANSLDLQFDWQPIDLASGAPLSAQNTAFTLQANQPETILLRLSAGSAIAPEELVVDAWCDEGQATNAIAGLNTLEFSATATPTADVVALTVSAQNDGTVSIPDNGEFGFFSMATFNVGASEQLTVQPVITGTANAQALVCQTDPATGLCRAGPEASVLLTMGANEAASFAVFVRADQRPTFNLASNRISVMFIDSNGVNRGRTSLALR